MIKMIIECYFTILLAVGVASLAVFCLGLYWIFKKKRNTTPSTPPEETQFKNEKRALSLAEDRMFDVSAISGDDPVATQLDLARAYIETGKAQLAKKILQSVATQGSRVQQQEALTILNSL